MRSTRSKYHYMVRNLKRTRDTQIRAALGRALLLNGNRDYSRELKKIRGKVRSVTSVIDGFTESKDIANAFASKYSVLYNSVISPDAELQFMSQSIEQGIHTQCLQDCSFSHCISKDDVIRAVKHLNPGKSGGASGVMSDSVIHGTNMLFEYITCLFNSILRHGISPDEFLVSILIPIPKGHRVDTGNSSNYRAVALSSIYGKILDNIILSVQQEELKTSDLQFGYKSESSTIMCSTMVIETIQYFTACHSPIYVLYMDASKAFDRLYHIELFRLLSERAVCPLILRLLFNMYRKQRIQVRWGDSLSDMFSMSNGVKQGAVLSPVLFTAYFDKLFERLRASGIGCHVGKMYAGAFGYADDVVLLAPSLDALREMVSICETYATEYHLLFNPSKSKLMYFNISHDNLSVKLCGKEVLLVSHETYLGNFIGSDIFDRAITQSVCAFNQSGNHLIADFSMIDSFSLHKLHSNYCMSLYGCELWNYNSRYINDIYVAWRKVIRKLFKLPYRTHNYLVCGIVECITVKLDRRLTKFVHSMINSKNSTVRELIAHFLTTESSVFAENCRYLMYKYDISVFAWYGSLYDVMNCIKNIQNVSNEHASNIASIKELCKIRDKVVYSELSPLEANTLIELICTN